MTYPSPTPAPACHACNNAFACPFAVIFRPPPACPACGRHAKRLTADGMLEAVASCKALAVRQAQKFRRGNPAIPMRDLVETAEFGLRLAAVHFDPSRGNKYVTVAHRFAWLELLAYCQLESAGGMHVPKDGRVVHIRPHYGFGEEWQHPPARNESPLELAETESFWRAATRRLDPRSARVVLGVYRDGSQQVDLGAELGISKERVRQILRAACAKIADHRELREFAMGGRVARAGSRRRAMAG